MVAEHESREKAKYLNSLCADRTDVDIHTGDATPYLLNLDCPADCSFRSVGWRRRLAVGVAFDGVVSGA